MTAPALSGYHEKVVERRERVVELTRLGHSASEISVRLGITKRQVARIRTAEGIAQAKAAPLTADEIRIAAELLDDGCSYSEVARTVGRSPRAISGHFPGRGWPVGEGGRLGAFNRWANFRINRNSPTAHVAQEIPA